MTNPLQPVYDSFHISISALKVVSRCAKLSSIERRRVFSNTLFKGRAGEEAIERLDESKEEIESLAVLSLFAAFERTLREQLVLTVDAMENERTERTAGAAFFGFLRKEAERWGMDEVVQFFRPMVSDEDIAGAGNIRKFRHWVAHGRKQGEEPPNVKPSVAFSQLTAFLNKIGAL